jgi:hypothetical protein
MDRGRTEIERLRDQVIRELADLPVRPWTPRRSSARAGLARQVSGAWRRSMAAVRGLA